MNRQAVTLPRLIVVRLLWYAAVGALAVMALASQTQFSVAAVLSAIAVYVPLSMLGLPLMAWLGLSRANGMATRGPAPVWPCWLTGGAGIALLAGYHLSARLELAECGVLLLLVAVDLALVRRESLCLAGRLGANPRA
jgi:hypothetical protein